MCILNILTGNLESCHFLVFCSCLFDLLFFCNIWDASSVFIVPRYYSGVGLVILTIPAYRLVNFPWHWRCIDFCFIFTLSSVKSLLVETALVWLFFFFTCQRIFVFFFSLSWIIFNLATTYFLLIVYFASISFVAFLYWFH